MKLIGVFFSSLNTNPTHKGAIKLTWSLLATRECHAAVDILVLRVRICSEFSVYLVFIRIKLSQAVCIVTWNGFINS